MRRPRSLRQMAAALAFLAAACGKKGDPRPPLRPTPATITDLRLAQRGDKVEIHFSAPRTSTDGARLPVIEIEILEAQGDGDFAKIATLRKIKVAPGEVITETEALPAPGSTLRLAARAVAKGHKGRLTDPARLLVIAPLVPPSDLAARLVGEGVALAWQGEVPAPLPTPAPTPTPTSSLTGISTSSPVTAPTGNPSTNPTSAPAPIPAASPTPTTTPTPAPTPPLSPTAPATNAAGQAVPSGLAPTSTPAPIPEPTPEPFAPGFFIYRRAAANAYGAPLAPTPSVDRTFTDRTAQPGESWCYVIRAVAAAQPLVESAPTNEACIDVKDVLAPAAPAGLAVIPRDEGIELSWSPSPEPDLLAYRIYRSVRRGGPPERLAEVAAPETTYLDKDPPEGALIYGVTAVDRAGNESPVSAAEARRP